MFTRRKLGDRQHGAKNLACRADLLARVNGVLVVA